jgi:hypothetical protein
MSSAKPSPLRQRAARFPQRRGSTLQAWPASTGAITTSWAHHGRQGGNPEPLELKPGRTIPVTERCACHAQGVLDGTNGVEIDLDPEANISRCDTCEWIYDPAEETLFNH